MSCCALRPDIGDVPAPDLIWRLHCEFTVEVVRNIDPFHRSLLIGMAARLFAEQPQLFHQTTGFEAANCRAFLAHHAHDAATSRRTATLDEQLVYAATQCHALNINVPGALPMRIQA